MNIELILILIFVIIVLILVHLFTTNDTTDPSIINGFKVGNGQMIGEKDYQNDYFSVIPSENNQDDLLAVIAGSVIDKQPNKLDAVVSVEIVKNNFKKMLYKKVGIQEFFMQSLEQIKKRLPENISGNNMSITLNIILVENKVLHYASIGKGMLFLYRKGELINLTPDADITPKLQIKKAILEPKDIIMITSQACRSLAEKEISWQLSRRKSHPIDKCQKLLKQMHQKRLKQDNTTIIILEEMG